MRTVHLLGLLAAAVTWGGCVGAIGARGQPAAGGGGGGNGGPAVTTALCGAGTPAAAALPARVRRLTRLEIGNTLADLFGDTTATMAADLEPDSLAVGFSTGDERGVTPGYADGLRTVAQNVAAAFRKTVAQPVFAATCFATDAGARACADQFIRDVGRRAYRHPLPDGEVGPLLAVFDAGRDTGADGDAADRFRAGLDYTVRALIQSPEFIFRTELGEPGAPAGSAARLTPSELASAISYGVLASPPDPELARAADAGQLASAAQIAAQVRRLMSAHPDRFATQVQRFVLEWLGIDYDKPEWNKDTTLFPKFTAATKRAFQQETALYLQDWAAAGPVLPALLTGASSYIGADNATVYGVVSSAVTPQKTVLDPAQRAGILTQPSFLGTYAHTDGSSPVFRGVAIMRRFLCQDPPPVPAVVPPLPAVDKAAIKTTRQRYAQHTSAAFCAACHSQFDPMGDAFESYDAVGAYRTQENGVDVDSSGAIVGSAASDGPVAGGVAMAQALARSPDVHQCVARQVYRFTLGRLETDADRCGIAQAAKGFTDQGLDLRDLLVGIATAPAFAVRAVPTNVGP